MKQLITLKVNSEEHEVAVSPDKKKHVVQSRFFSLEFVGKSSLVTALGGAG